MQNKDKDAPLFDEYCKVEDGQQAIISIIVQQIYNTSSPIDINELMNKYDRVFYELVYLQKGKYYQEFIKTIETAYTICYGENGSYKYLVRLRVLDEKVLPKENKSKKEQTAETAKMTHICPKNSKSIQNITFVLSFFALILRLNFLQK